MTQIAEMTPAAMSAFATTAIKNKMPLLIVGAPGIGKSDVVALAAEQAGAHLKIMHPVVSSPIDFKGLPYVGEGNVAKYLPDTQLRELIDADEPTVCFLDDLGQAPAAVQAACMQLILARRINGHHVSDNVTFMAATNRREDKAGVSGILEPVKSRFKSIMHLTVSVDDWCLWAIKHQMPTELIAFIRYRPDLLSDNKPSKDMVNGACPRTLAAVGEWMNLGVNDLAVWASAAGQGLAVELQGFMKVWKNLPKFASIVADPNNAPLPDMDELSVVYATVGMLTKNTKLENVESVFTYIKRLQNEFQVLYVKDLTNKDDEFAMTAPYQEWSIENQGII